MNREASIQVPLPSRPITDDSKEWIAYWKAKGQPWRTEPEIPSERQEELTQHRAIVPDIEKGIYPFKRVKLNRADVEWLLATHENGRGPVDWSNEKEQDRQGLDLRGADLRQVNLRRLPLARLYGGLPLDEAIERRTNTYQEQSKMASVLMENARAVAKLKAGQAIKRVRALAR